MTTLVLFAMITVVLAALGLYGMMAYTVSERIAEVGVRMALGATPNHIIGMFTVDGLRAATRGIAVGLLLAGILWQALSALLYGIEWLDAVVFVAAPVGLMVLAAVASGVPALRAGRLSPAVALRDTG
jgi:ABC-type lipoprotein release transport system permease subunit